MLSMKAKYAIRALGVLAEGEGMMLSTKVLSEKAQVSKKFLESILLELKNHKVVDSKRGVLGGYFLTLPADNITIGDLIRYIDGPLAQTPCASITAYKKCEDCPTSEEECSLHHIMVDARNAVAAILDNKTLKDMVTHSKKNKNVKVKISPNRNT